MALIKFGAGVENMSGKLGGSVYARNRAGNYARAWRKPVNPQTPSQGFVRGLFQNAVALWAGLTDVQRSLWNDYAALLVRQNRLGETYTPKGRQIFVEVQQNLQLMQQPPLLEPSAYYDTPSVERLQMGTVTSQSGTIQTAEVAALSGSFPSGGDFGFLLQAAPIYPSTVTNVKKRFRTIMSNIQGPNTANLDILPAFVTVFGQAGTVGEVFAVRARAIDIVSGLGSEFIADDTRILPAS